jgi:Cu+-exporting ATPase
MGLPHERYLRPKFYVAAALSLPVLVLAMWPMVSHNLYDHLTMQQSAWIQFVLTTPVFFWSGWPFIRRWAKAIRERDPNMFLLTVTGTGAAYFFSAAVVLLWEQLPRPRPSRPRSCCSARSSSNAPPRAPTLPSAP